MTGGIEVVRGELDRQRAAELLDFWWERRALSGDEARRRLPEVVCLLRHGGAVLGSSSAYPADIPLIGGRRFWIYRSLLDAVVAEQAPAMIRATFRALEAEFDGSESSPIGLCVLVGDPDQRRRRPEAVWSDPELIYAGYLGDGRQVRIGYFGGARIAPGGSRSPGASPTPAANCRIELLSEQDAVGADDVMKLWLSEGVLSPEEARQRVPEVLLVAVDEHRRPVGVCTTYLRRNEQLRSDLWYGRVFVATPHRRTGLALELAFNARNHLAERFASGIDRRGIGLIFDVESEILQRFFPDAVWPRTHFAFIGEGPGGSHTRVYYFAGALAPEPPQGNA